MSFHEDHTLETYKSMISVSVEGLKTLLLINGGAIVAMLAYLGQASQGQAAAQHARIPLAYFVAGIIFCFLAFVGAYATQFFLFNEATHPTPVRRPSHMTALWVAVVFIGLSLACFTVGAFASVQVLSRYGGQADTKTTAPNCHIK